MQRRRQVAIEAEVSFDCGENKYGLQAYKDDGDHREHHNGSALKDCFVRPADGCFCLDNIGLLLLHIHKVTKLSVERQYCIFSSCPFPPSLGY